MFDIQFVMRSQQLKRRIASNPETILDRLSVVEEFEWMRSENPFVFNIEVTNNCNMRCIMCPRTSLMTRKIKSIGTNTFEKVLEQITPYSNETLTTFSHWVEDELKVSPAEESEDHFYYFILAGALNLHGYGETMIDPNVVQRVQACTDRGFPSYFSCVPANIKPDRTLELMKAGLSYLKFALESLDDDRQREIRGKRADFTNAFEKIKKAVKLKKVHQQDTLLIGTMLEMSNTPEHHNMHMEFQKLMRGEGIYSYIKTQDNRWLHEETSVERKGAPKEYCEYPWTSLTVMADGNVVPCTQDYDCEMVMGNVNEQSLDEIWNGEKYKEFRRSHILGDFPKEFKCASRCDNAMVCDRLDGKVLTRRVM